MMQGYQQRVQNSAWMPCAYGLVYATWAYSVRRVWVSSTLFYKNTMTELDLGKTLKIEAQGDIRIENLINAVYNDAVNVTVNVYGNGVVKEEAEERVVSASVPPSKDESEEAREAAEVKLAVEDEEMLLPMFKGNRENLRQFFAEVWGLRPTQITAQVNEWVKDGRISKECTMKDLWSTLKKMELYGKTYQAWNKQVK